MKIFSFVGYSKSGKTTVIEYLTEALTRRGYSVVVIKHIHRQVFEVDHKGKDTWRAFKAGASLVVGVSEKRFFLFSKIPNTAPLEKILKLIDLIHGEADFIFIEGQIRSIGNIEIPVVLLIKEDKEIEDFEILRDRVVAIVYRDEPINKNKIKEIFGEKPIIRIDQKEKLLEAILNTD